MGLRQLNVIGGLGEMREIKDLTCFFSSTTVLTGALSCRYDFSVYSTVSKSISYSLYCTLDDFD